MANYLKEYIETGITNAAIIPSHIMGLLREYHAHTGRHLLIFTANPEDKTGNSSMQMDDYYVIHQLLNEAFEEEIDVYLETPGGRADAAEEIALFLHAHFNSVGFVIASEAKSAGTILVMSGDRIAMTETGSLGPIDAQIRRGNMVYSAHAYLNWLENLKRQISEGGVFHPVDQSMIAHHVHPGDVENTKVSLERAKTLVREWLEKYKFKDWEFHSTSGEPVTQEERRIRASEIAEDLCNNAKWQSHGKSIKISDLRQYLKIERVEDDEKRAEIVGRIKVLLRLFFASSKIEKLYIFREDVITKAVNSGGGGSSTSVPLPQAATRGSVKIQCTTCGHENSVAFFMRGRKREQVAMAIEEGNIVSSNGRSVQCLNCTTELDLSTLIALVTKQVGQEVEL